MLAICQFPQQHQHRLFAADFTSVDVALQIDRHLTARTDCLWARISNIPNHYQRQWSGLK